MHRRTSLYLIGSACAVRLPAAPAPISFQQDKDKVRVLSGAAELTAFHYGPEFDRPFLHPLITPAGITVSRGVPPGPGEASDHAWHRGLWYGHGDVSGADFWREKVDAAGKKTTGRIIVSQAPLMEGRTLTARCAFTTAEGKVIGSCMQRFRFSQEPGHTLIDVNITLHADAGADQVMGDSDDGGLAVRLTGAFEQDKGATLLNSEGQKGTENLWGKSARWVDYSGSKDGKPCGVAILDHPGNFRFPTQWHARGYGLNSANPFAAGSFLKASKNDPRRNLGRHTIKQGTFLTLRYRVSLHDGDAAQAGIEKLHKQFAMGR